MNGNMTGNGANRAGLADAGSYVRARRILNELRQERMFGRITDQQYRTLRAQALAGDVDGATKGLANLMMNVEGTV